MLFVAVWLGWASSTVVDLGFGLLCSCFGWSWLDELTCGAGVCVTLLIGF